MRPRRSRDEGLPISPTAVGIGIGIWISVFLILAFVVVPILFGQCTARAPA